jgi:hypothetical protein
MPAVQDAKEYKMLTAAKDHCCPTVQDAKDYKMLTAAKDHKDQQQGLIHQYNNGRPCGRPPKAPPRG